MENQVYIELLDYIKYKHEIYFYFSFMKVMSFLSQKKLSDNALVGQNFGFLLDS